MVIFKGSIEVESYFSNDLQHRYYLRRKYKSDKYSNVKKQKLCYILINPSYADELLFDKTNRLASNIGVRENYNEVVILNMYSLITKDSKILKKNIDVASDLTNDQVILDECLNAERIIVSWGIDKRFDDRRMELLNLLETNAVLQNLYKIVYTGEDKVYDPAHLSMYLTDNPYNFEIKKFVE
ncbi:DUF1643 domain-containing protein [Lysinibacillus xylanilyticus]|uniref:DUF1643 domain-containing protein n=1 Tax=Lysinibacillus xylanilyticus TaxID=582475 RepID=UPI0037FD6B6B